MCRTKYEKNMTSVFLYVALLQKRSYIKTLKNFFKKSQLAQCQNGSMDRKLSPRQPISVNSEDEKDIIPIASSAGPPLSDKNEEDPQVEPDPPAPYE